MKRHFYTLCLLTIALTACIPGETESPTGKLTISPNSLTMKVDDMEVLTTSGATETIVWSSSNEDVAIVTLGVVEAKGIGDSYITARSGKLEAVCHVYVTGSDGSSLRLTPNEVELEKGETFQYRYGNTYDLSLVWSSSNEEVATVDQNGLVTAIKPGVTFITLDNGGETRTSVLAVKHKWSNYELVWSDEFDGSSLDEKIWTIQTGIGNNGWGNGEKQYYTGRNENLRVEDGNLIIEARKEEYERSEYTSARIMTKDKKTFTYGKIEASINLPGGGGLWPAFWMLGNSGGWPSCGEIDIMEYVGNAKNRILGTLHTNKDRDGGKSSRAYSDCKTIEDNYHIYGIEWAQEEKSGKDVIRFYVDDHIYSEQWESQIDNHDYWPFNKPHFFIINMAVGGNLGGKINDEIWTTPRLMKIDWVRVYQRHEIE